MLIDKNDVIKGLSQHFIPRDDGAYNTQCVDCPFHDSDDCEQWLLECTLRLVKDQERKIKEFMKSFNELIEKGEPVVRCKDCLYRTDKEAQDNHPSWLPCMEIKTRGDFYCSEGVRRDD